MYIFIAMLCTFYLQNTRLLIYLIFLMMAMIFKGPIGVGTLLIVCLSGLILNYFMSFTKKLLEQAS